MPKIEPQDNKSLRNGLITESAVSEYDMPKGAVTESVNFQFNKIGTARLRKGTTLLGNQLSGNILGLYEFRDSGSGSNNRIIAVNGTVLYYLSGNTWASQFTGLTTGLKTRFTTFLDFVWMVNGTDSTRIWNGDPSNNFVATGNAASAPTGKFIENFRSRVWITGNSTYPDRLYFSTLPSAVTTPVVEWDTDVTTGNWIDISPSDGENITGLKRAKSTLLVFKNNHIYRVSSINSTEPDPQINVGTYSNESIVEAKNGVYFHHPSGFYRYVEGGVQEISKPIIDIINNISAANYDDIAGWLEADGDNIVWAVGDVTINGVTYTNLEVRYTISTESWTHYQKPTQSLVSSRYNDGTTLFQLVGDNNGNVLKVDTGVTDNGTAISYSLIHNWDKVDGVVSTKKTINKMLFHHKGGQGSKVSYQKEDDLVSDWKKPVGKGSLVKSMTYFTNPNVQGKNLRFRISGSSTGEPFDYYGYEILAGTSELTND